VQEIYLKINNEHVRLVVSNFNNYVTQHIFNKKAYMRTALYNVVFEIEAHYVNINDMSLDWQTEPISNLGNENINKKQVV